MKRSWARCYRGVKPKLPAIGFVGAETVSLLGNQLAAVAIPVLVLTHTGSPVAVGVASAGTALPVVLSALVGGRLIDRLGAWRMSVASDVLSFVSVLALPLAYHYFEPPLTWLFALVLLGALFDPTGVASRQTLVPHVSHKTGVPLTTLNAWRGALENGADFLGPGLAGLAIALLGVAGALYLNAGTFLVCAVLFALSVPWSRRVEEVRNDDATLAGVSFLFAEPDLRALAIVGSLLGFGLLPFLGVLLPVVAMERFESTALLALALTGFGFAATVGAASFSWLSRRVSRRTLYYGGILLTGLAIALSALARTPFEVILAATLAGLVLGSGNPLQQTVLQERTPEGIAGRVFTTLSAVQVLGGPLGLVLAGLIAERSGIEVALGVSGLLLIVVAVSGWVFLPLREAQ